MKKIYLIEATNLGAMTRYVLAESLEEAVALYRDRFPGVEIDVVYVKSTQVLMEDAK